MSNTALNAGDLWPPGHPVPGTCPFSPSVGRLPGAGTAGRGAGRDRHGVDRRGTADAVVVPGLPAEHQPVGPNGLELRRQRRLSCQRLFRRRYERDSPTSRGATGGELGGAVRHPAGTRRRSRTQRPRPREYRGQRRRALLQRGQGHCYRGPHGATRSAERVRHDCGGRRAARPACRSGRADGLLQPRPVEHAGLRHCRGAASDPGRHEAGRARRLQRRGHPGRRRPFPDQRAVQSGPHPCPARTRGHPGHLVRPPARPRQPGPARGGAGDHRAVPPGRSGLLPRHLDRRGQGGAGREAEAIALGAFGVIAALAALLIAAQAISRLLHESDEDAQVLRALGAGPSTTLLDGLIGILAAVGLGSLLACALAVALSPLAPLGPVRAVYPSSGIAVDWTVLGVGMLVLVVALDTIAVALAYRGLPHRVARRSRAVPGRSSSIVRAAAASGLSTSGVVGVRFALESGRARTAVPVRSALSGAAVAVMLVVATLTFGSSLHTLVSRPAVYGWNWSYALYSVNNIPPQARAPLGHDPDVAATAIENALNVQIDGQNVPALVGDADAALGPPILSGHALAGRDQIVLGAATLARLHKHVGDTVIAGYGTPSQAPLYVPPTRLVIVGTATLPAISTSGTLADHTSMGTGALLSSDVAPPAFQQAVTN